MSFCSFASPVGGACGPGIENLNDVQFVDLKICSREVNWSFVKSSNHHWEYRQREKFATCLYR